MREYTDRFQGFQIRDCSYFGKPPTDIPPTFDIVKWKQHDEPMEVTDFITGKKKMQTEYCYSVGYLVYDKEEPCFRFQSVGLRWLEEHPSEEVERWIIKWTEYKLEELNNEYDC